MSAFLGGPSCGHFNSKSSGKEALHYEIHVLIEEKVSESSAARNEYSRGTTSPGTIGNEHLFFVVAYFL